MTREGYNWSVVAPTELRPPKVAKAVNEAQRLRELQQTEQQALITATVELERAEADDVAALAASFRTGSEAQPRTEQVEQARMAVREHERRVQAAGEALSAAEADVGSELQRARESWLASAAKESERVRQQCRDALDALRAGLDSLTTLRALAEWLSDGIEPKALRGRGLLHAPSSRTAMANGDPVGGDLLLQWTAELIDPPSKREPIEHEPPQLAARIDPAEVA